MRNEYQDLLDATMKEPPPRLDLDSLIARSRARARRRSWLIGAGGATGVAAVVVLVAVVVGQALGNPQQAGGGPVTGSATPSAPPTEPSVVRTEPPAGPPPTSFPASTDRPPGSNAVVLQVSGVVRDAFTNEPIAGVAIMMQDSGDHIYRTVSDADGQYRFVSSPGRDITPGVVALQATKDGYGKNNRTATGLAGSKVTNLTITLVPNTVPAPS